MLGPSGCGKTSTLRLIAGFERPDEGAILLDGVDMSRTPPHKRNVNTVFQSYALFPHKSVADNIAFGLRYKKVTKAEQQRRVDEAMDLVRLQGLGERRPAQLSGGQQQRVALARALVLEPPVLLLDEPLGALDARLRIDLQVELKRIQEQLEVTFIYVTHDQDEALTMSDRVAVMRDGRIEQCAAPQELYEQPETAFVANFLGAANLVPVTARPDGDGAALTLGDFTLRSDVGCEITGDALAMIRPEYVRHRGARDDGREPDSRHGRGGRLPRLPPGRARAPGDRRAGPRRRAERRRRAGVLAGRRRRRAPAPAQPAGARRRRGGRSPPARRPPRRPRPTSRSRGPPRDVGRARRRRPASASSTPPSRASRARGSTTRGSRGSPPTRASPRRRSTTTSPRARRSCRRPSSTPTSARVTRGSRCPRPTRRAPPSGSRR